MARIVVELTEAQCRALIDAGLAYLEDHSQNGQHNAAQMRALDRALDAIVAKLPKARRPRHPLLTR